MDVTIEFAAMDKMLNRARIRQLRDDMKMSQTEAAKAAGRKTSWWSDIENPRKKRTSVTLQTLFAVAAVLGCDPCDLLLKPKRPAPRRKR